MLCHMGNYVRREGADDLELYNLDDVNWADAPRPPLFHRHWAQTKGWVGLREVWRCACGALGEPGKRWALLGWWRLPTWLRRKVTR